MFQLTSCSNLLLARAFEQILDTAMCPGTSNPAGGGTEGILSFWASAVPDQAL